MDKEETANVVVFIGSSDGVAWPTINTDAEHADCV